MPDLTVNDLAAALGISARRIRKLAAARSVGKRIGAQILFTPRDIERLRPGPPGRPRVENPARKRKPVEEKGE